MAQKKIDIIISAKDQTEAATRAARQNLGFMEKTSREVAQKQAQTFKGGMFGDVEKRTADAAAKAAKIAQESADRQAEIQRIAGERAQAAATADADRLKQIEAENNAVRLEAKGDFLNAEITRLEEHYRQRIELAKTSAEKEALAQQLSLRKDSLAQNGPTAGGGGGGFLQGGNATSLLRGAGAAAIFTFAGKKLNTVLDELAKLQAEVASGAITYAEAQEKATVAIVKAIPIVGEFVKAGEKMGRMFTEAGKELTLLEAQNKALEQQIEARTKIAQIVRDMQASAAKERAGLEDRITLAPLTGGARTVAERGIAARKELEEAEAFQKSQQEKARAAQDELNTRAPELRAPVDQTAAELQRVREDLKTLGSFHEKRLKAREAQLEAELQAQIKALDTLQDDADKAHAAALAAEEQFARRKEAIAADLAAAEKALARQTADTISDSARAVANIEAEANENRLRAAGAFAEAETSRIARETEERIRIRREALMAEAVAETDDGRRQQIEQQITREIAAIREQGEQQTADAIEQINLQLAERRRAIEAETTQQLIQNLRALGTEEAATQAAQLENEQQFAAKRERLIALTKDMMATEAQRAAAQEQLNRLAGDEAIAAEKAVNDTREQFAQRRETVAAQLARAEIAHLRETGQLSDEQAKRQIKELDTRRKLTEEANALLKIEQDMALTEEQRAKARELREGLAERQRKALAEAPGGPSNAGPGGISGQALSSRFMDLAGSARAGDPIQIAQSTLDKTQEVAANTGETATQVTTAAVNTGKTADAAAETAAKTETVAANTGKTAEDTAKVEKHTDKIADATKETEKNTAKVEKHTDAMAKELKDMQKQLTKLPASIAAELRKLISNTATLDVT